MNQATKRSLLKFLDEEAAPAKHRVKSEENQYNNAISEDLDKRINSLRVELDALFLKLSKKHNFALVPNKSRNLLYCCNGYFKETVELQDRKHNNKNLHLRIKKIDAAFSKTEREILLGSDKDASVLLASFVSELKNI